jgi:hypothetical protein
LANASDNEVESSSFLLLVDALLMELLRLAAFSTKLLLSSSSRNLNILLNVDRRVLASHLIDILEIMIAYGNRKRLQQSWCDVDHLVSG